MDELQIISSFGFDMNESKNNLKTALGQLQKDIKSNNKEIKLDMDFGGIVSNIEKLSFKLDEVLNKPRGINIKPELGGFSKSIKDVESLDNRLKQLKQTYMELIKGEQTYADKTKFKDAQGRLDRALKTEGFKTEDPRNKVLETIKYYELRNEELKKETKIIDDIDKKRSAILQKERQEYIKHQQELANENNKRLEKEYSDKVKLQQETKNKLKKEKSDKYDNTYKEAEDSIKRQIELQKTLVNAGEEVTKTTTRQLKEEEAIYKKLKMQLELQDRVNLTKQKDSMYDKAVKPAIDKKIDNMADKEKAELIRQQKYEEDLRYKVRKQQEQDLANMQTKLYNELDSLQRQEFSLKEKMVGKDYESKAILQEQLDIIKKQQREKEKEVNQKGLVSNNRNEKLINSRQSLQTNLDVSMHEEEKRIEQIQRDIANKTEQFTNKIKLQMKELNRVYGNYIPKEKVEEFNQSLQKINNGNYTSLKGLNADIAKVNQGFAEMAQQSKATKSNDFLQSLGYNMKKFGEFLLGGTLIMQFGNAIQSAVKYTYDMDRALTDLSKVVTISSGQMNEMKLSAIDLGKALGKSSVEVMQGMSEFGRITKDLGEIKELTRVSLMGANVSDLNAQEMSSALGIVLTTFKLQASDAIKVLDSLNEVQNNYRVSAKDMIEGVSEVGVVAKQSGVSLEELQGELGVLIQSMGISGSEAGNSLKGIMSRMFKLGKDGEDDAGKSEEVLKKIGINIRNAQNQFRPFNDIILELGSSWKNLTNTQQINVAQTVGG